ncbi:hypothetical protein Pyn_40471 [Prunus yedoensis var. nudiflora]|uniref:Uncharacterized protein n=1 Tax=Prunus yedoensis var. nudiflora TaxID=2094558 RepID=A0A314Y441_PRUYE|nr:hypothetical protein Pyn_40471 [Prunus yedoensis var. nudiflora]
MQFGCCDNVDVNFENWSAVCYGKYDLNLGDWMQYVRSGLVNDVVTVNVMVGERCMCPYWIDEIRHAGYVKRLKNHPFLKTPEGRMRYFDKLHCTKDSDLRKLLNSITFQRFRPWNTKAGIASWKDYIKENLLSCGF